MHRRLREHLKVAQGDSCRVIAVFLDIRGFTSFAGSTDSTETAAFLRAMYSRIVSDYFPDACFFKPTGDGLMVILDHPLDDNELDEAMARAIGASTRLVADFPTIADDDVMVNFDTPQNLGIGIARGSVTRLHADDITLDYSGRYLNLAARLMDLSRPKGVTVQDRFATRFFGKLAKHDFVPAEVYIKGIAEEEPLEVYYTSGWTEISAESLRPRQGPQVYYDPRIVTYSLKELRDSGTKWRNVQMSRPTVDPDSVEVHWEYRPRDGSGIRYGDSAGEMHVQPEGNFIRFDANRLFERLDRDRPKALTLSTAVRLQAKYLAVDTR